MSFDLATIERAADLTPTGLTLPPALSFEEWEAIGRGLCAMEQAVQWWVGDWINYGERQYGEKYAQAVEATGYSLQTLMHIASVAARVETCRRRQVLPFSAHAEVAQLEPGEQDAILEAAANAGATVREVREAVRTFKRELVSTNVENETCSVADLTELVTLGSKFGTIYVDPPWPYSNQATRAATGNHYGVMSLDDIAALPVKQLAADDSHCHMWTTNAFLFEARRLMEGWGFEYKSCFVWVKTQMGIGNYWRVSHEFMLLGIRGHAPFKNRGQMSWHEWDRTQHSEKPYEMYSIIEAVSPGPYLELFARQQQRGWTSWGNEIARDLFYEEAS